ncbi:hypothetical protein BO70DRAFT_180687 [Aspergillus heteromorphus CBS 117.55]|uniref:Uncharacterized protein n=1 Tax=Aspergillus heteromorphus CBS 117.55 TaxID=1448321 RepID=A0A317WPQ4_9EURO|nr:uncharacterized protein BO70DRAFT_180687 [Aspergillus heteromorphus CBS 117.55]PWY88409.1 hypothetical protein BO70DRAFT_180687 [Aspergillus heteromorphus CBS 117.55]
MEREGRGIGCIFFLIFFFFFCVVWGWGPTYITSWYYLPTYYYLFFRVLFHTIPYHAVVVPPAFLSLPYPYPYRCLYPCCGASSLHCIDPFLYHFTLDLF